MSRARKPAPPLAVGDTVYFVRSWDELSNKHLARLLVLTVQSVGRIWAVCNVPDGPAHMAVSVDIATLEVKPDRNDNRIGRAFRSEADWREDRAREKAWDAIREYVANHSYRRPEHLASGDLWEIFVKLGGNRTL